MNPLAGTSRLNRRLIRGEQSLVSPALRQTRKLHDFDQLFVGKGQPVLQLRIELHLRSETDR
jgi:hypothetical protein